MTYPITRTKDWASNEILSETDLEAEFDAVYTNLSLPINMDNVASTTADIDPNNGATVPATVAEEIQQLRFQIKTIGGLTNWNDTASVAGTLTAHALDSTSHTGTLAWASVSKTSSDLADLATAAHSSLSGVTSDLHHAQAHQAAHTYGGADALVDTTVTDSFSVRTAALAPAAAGVIRIHNNSKLVARNNADGGDLELIGTNTSDELLLKSIDFVNGGYTSNSAVADHSGSGWVIVDAAETAAIANCIVGDVMLITGAITVRKTGTTGTAIIGVYVDGSLVNASARIIPTADVTTHNYYFAFHHTVTETTTDIAIHWSVTSGDTLSEVSTSDGYHRYLYGVCLRVGALT